MCVLSACLSEKQMQLYLITEEVCASLITNQGHRAERGRFRPVCEKMHESHRRAEKGRGEKDIEVCRLIY